MNYFHRYVATMALGLAVIAPSDIASARILPSTATPVLSMQISRPVSYLAMQNYSLPPWRTFENILHRDAMGWAMDRYVIESLSDVTHVDGSLSSGNWSARGYYYYISGMTDERHTGWVIFRYRNGYVDCLVYHNFYRTCRRPNGY
jgi:hypothetical protein